MTAAGLVAVTAAGLVAVTAAVEMGLAAKLAATRMSAHLAVRV